MKALKLALLFAAALANAPVCADPLSLDPAVWHIRFSPHMPNNPTAVPPMAGGGWVFSFPLAAPGVCPYHGTRQPPNFDQGMCPHPDYVTTPHNMRIDSFGFVTMTFKVSVVPGTVFDFHTEDGNTCSTPATVRFLIQHIGDQNLNTPNYRWWSNPISFALADTSGPIILTAPLTPDQWSNVNGQVGTTQLAGFNDALRNIQNIGMTFGGGCFFGHGVYLTAGEATFNVQNFALQ